MNKTALALALAAAMPVAALAGGGHAYLDTNAAPAGATVTISTGARPLDTYGSYYAGPQNTASFAQWHEQQAGLLALEGPESSRYIPQMAPDTGVTIQRVYVEHGSPGAGAMVSEPVASLPAETYTGSTVVRISPSRDIIVSRTGPLDLHGDGNISSFDVARFDENRAGLEPLEG